VLRHFYLVLILQYPILQHGKACFTMERNDATEQYLLPAPSGHIVRKPVRTNNTATNQSEPHALDNGGLLSSIGGDSGTPTISEAGVQNHKPKVKHWTAGYHNVGPDREKHTPPSSDERSTFARLAQDWWLNELLGLILSLLAFLAIVIVLKVYENHTLPDWPYNVTLNTFLALFTTIASTGLMVAVLEALSQLKWIWFMRIKRPLADFQTYEEACRGGVINGIKLLWALKGR
jgi:hypothetical protein